MVKPIEHADGLVREIMRIREDSEPDADPGDLTIVIQDDMDLVEVVQRGQVIAYGPTLTGALAEAVRNIKRGRAVHEELWDFETAWTKQFGEQEAKPLKKGEICEGCGRRAEEDGENHQFCYPGMP